MSARDVPDQTLQLRAVDNRVDTLVIGSQQDGLLLAYSDASVQVWERPSALPRIRWAGASTVIEDPAARLAALADPATPPSTVVLSTPGPEASGGSAQLTVTDDSGDRVAVDVQAAGAGYLVVADAIQSGWTVSVNGEPADLVDADHAFGAVVCPRRCIHSGVPVRRHRTADGRRDHRSEHRHPAARADRPASGSPAEAPGRTRFVITGSPRRRPIRVPWLQVVASFVVLAAFFVVVAVRLGRPWSARRPSPVSTC